YYSVPYWYSLHNHIPSEIAFHISSSPGMNFIKIMMLPMKIIFNCTQPRYHYAASGNFWRYF
ncbi:hypothetical protein WDZ92_05660, partial [Nostoc sp. NIES-2111]